MTFLISAFGFADRIAGSLLTSALGWASNLLFGRVPHSHQRFVLLMMAASVLWAVLLLGLLIPSVAAFYLAATPHPPFVNAEWVGFVLLVGVITLPLVVGLAGYLVPAEGRQSSPTRLPTELARGYILAPVIVGLLVFLAGVGIVRKARSRRHGWSDVHVAIVSETGRYDELVDDLAEGLRAAGLDVREEDAPRILSVPSWVLTRVSGEHVRRLRPERLVELTGRNLRIGVYPSDIAISGTTATRVRARAAVLARLVTSPAHLTTTAEGQHLEDDLRDLAESHRSGRRSREAIARAFAEIDTRLLELSVPTDEWDTLYRLRIQAERDLLIGAEPGMEFPGSEEPATPASRPLVAGARSRA